MAQCPGGEEADQFTGTCVPHTVPNAGSQFSSIPGNPSLPAVNLPGGGGAIPCTGHNSGQCIGLAEEAAAAGPQAVPESTVGYSPTVTGGVAAAAAGTARVAYSWVMPAKSDPAELGDVEPLADSTARQARRVVAAYATDADECRVFLSMLGIGPSKLEA